MKLNTILPVALLILSSTACQNDNEPNLTYPNDPDAIMINPTISAIQSRVNTLAEGNAWTEGDQIKVKMIADDAVREKDAAVYKYATSWNIQGDNYMVWPSRSTSKTYTFQAFYPYAVGTSTSYTKFVLPNDQSSATTGQHFIGNADWMLAETTSAKADVVNLNFNHQLAKVIVTIKEYKDQYAGNLPNISIPQFAIPTTLTIPAEKDITVENNARLIKGLMKEDQSAAKLHTFTAVVIPGKYKTTDQFLTLQLNETTLNVKASDNAVLTQTGLEAGKAYTFNLTLGKRGFSIGNVTVNDWGASDWSEGEHGGVADEVPSL